jgi:hypothetical protein
MACLISVALSAQDKDWKKSLENELKKQYPARTTSGFRNDVKDPGITLAVRQAGVAATCETSLLMPTARVKNGIIVNAPSRTPAGQTVLAPGDQVYVRSISVSDNWIKFIVTTTEMFSAGGLDGAAATGNRPTRSRTCNAAVTYEFDKDFLSAADFGTVKKAINSVLASADEVAAANQKTIELGQTFEEVEKTLGKPVTVAKLGARTIYSYKDMKVIFTNGKVTDVQ